MALERIEVADIAEFLEIRGKLADADNVDISQYDEVLHEPGENFVSRGKHYVLVQKQEVVES